MFVLFAQEPVNVWLIFMLISSIFILIVMLVLALVFAQYFRWWIQSLLTGADITLGDLVGMTFRKVNIGTVVKAKIMAVQAGLGNDPELTSRALEAHQLSGGIVLVRIPSPRTEGNTRAK